MVSVLKLAWQCEGAALNAPSACSHASVNASCTGETSCGSEQQVHAKAC